MECNRAHLNFHSAIRFLPMKRGESENRAFGERLRAGMQHAGYSERGAYKRFATLYGVSQPVVSDWRKGRYLPEHPKAKRMAKEFECETDWLYYGEGPAPKWFGTTTRSIAPTRMTGVDLVAAHNQIALESLLEALVATTRGAAKAFLADVVESAHQRGVDPEEGFLLSLSDIAREAVAREATAALRPKRRSSSASKKL